MAGSAIVSFVVLFLPLAILMVVAWRQQVADCVADTGPLLWARGPHGEHGGVVD